MFLRRLFDEPSDQRMPRGWRVDLLDNVSKRGSGHTPDQTHPEYWNGGIKWVSLADSSKLDNVYIKHTAKQISELGIRNSSAALHPAGTVVLSRDAGVGKSAILATEMAVSQHFIAWTCGPELHNLFLYYWLQFMKPEFERQAVGSTIKTIGLPYFKKLEVVLPPLAEQRKIAAILGTWDAAIDRAERLVAALKARKKALMQRLLTGEMRFPGFGETGTNGILLDGWQEYRLDQIFKRVQRPASEPEHVLSITAKVGFVDQAAKFGRIIAGKTLERYTLLRKGEFAYNKGNSGSYPQGCIYRLEEFDEGAVPNVYYCFAPKRPDVDSDFYKFYFESGALNRQLSRLINSGVRNDGLLNLSAEEFFGIKVLMPPPPEQAAVGSVLTCADNEIGVASQNLAALRAQKRGLMQRLLTGEVRVAVDG